MKKEKNLSISKEIIPVIPVWLIWLQVIAFVVLYAVWILPGMVGSRNTALVVGALVSFYSIYQYRHAFFQKSALSLWCIVTFFIWAILHLLFLSQDYGQQSLELKRIWKYAALAVIFGFGFGLMLMNKDRSYLIQIYCWPLIYLGLSLPTVIFILKYSIINLCDKFELIVPEFLQIPHSSSLYYIPKYDYIAFCLPFFAVSLGCIRSLILSEQSFLMMVRKGFPIYFISILGVLFLFQQINTKNGFIHSALIVLIFTIDLLFRTRNPRIATKLLIIFSTILIILSVFLVQYKNNPALQTFFDDAEIAIQTERFPHWKYAGDAGYPLHPEGAMVSITNYERIAWFISSVRLIKDFPLGYGLIEDSFKYLAKITWPDASENLSHSHSGWVDLTLGVGLPGVLLILSAIIIILYNSKHVASPFKELIVCGLITHLLFWSTTETSTNLPFNELVFWTAWTCGLVIASKRF